MAPILKNRQYNYFPLGENLFLGTSARPNEITYSEDWMRPDYVPPPPPASAPVNPPAAPGVSPLAAEAPPAPTAQQAPTNPADGLRGMMVPSGGGH
jgi:phospholipid/cholesterol/gamma-HCH transport system substrate-binding protein